MQQQSIKLLHKDLSQDEKVAVLTYQCQPFVFSEGQFVMLSREIDGKIIKRAYSIASTQKEAQIGNIVFVVKQTETPLFSQYLVTDSQVGDEVGLLGPLGHMTWSDVYQNMLLISVGSGRGPMMGLTDTFLSQKNTKKLNGQIVHVFGERTYAQIVPSQQDCFDRREKDENYTGYYMLSRETENSCLQPKGKRQTGYVQDALDESLKKVGKNVQIFLCGHPAMVDDVRTMLLETGYVKEQIVFEKY